MSHFLIFIFFISFKLSASTYVSRIESIDYPENVSEDILLFLTTGQVVKLSANSSTNLELVQTAKLNNEWLKITTDDTREVVTLVPTNIPKHLKSTHPSQDSFVNFEYVPSVLKSLEWAQRYFNESKRNNKESQCYNRAHVWSYEWDIKHKFYSSKIFLFFTRKFIREHNFEWWFHVAPNIHVLVNNTVKERVMDMKYTRRPSTIGEWVGTFIKKSPQCITVKTYSDYANFPENGNCYIMRANMYYYLPLDLENEELHGTTKSSWLKDEIKMSYLEAFDIVKQ